MITIIYFFNRCKSLKTPSNTLILNLAICDFIMMVKTPIFIVNSFNEGPVFGRLGCSIFGLLGAYTAAGAAYTNAAIAWDRYRCISDPMGKRLSQKQASLIVLGGWLYASPVALVPYFELWSRFVPGNLRDNFFILLYLYFLITSVLEGYLTSCSFDYMGDTTSIKLFVFVLWVWCYVIPLSVIIYSYSKITRHVFQHEAKLKEQVGYIF